MSLLSIEQEEKKIELINIFFMNNILFTAQTFTSNISTSVRFATVGERIDFFFLLLLDIRNCLSEIS